jgi:hypothetical protein
MYLVQIKSINPSQSNHVGNSWIIGNRKFHTLHALSHINGTRTSPMVLASFSTLTCEYSILDGIMYLVQIKSINPSQSNHVGNSWIIGNRKFHTLHALSQINHSHNSPIVLASFSTLTREYSVLEEIMYV